MHSATGTAVAAYIGSAALTGPLVAERLDQLCAAYPEEAGHPAFDPATNGERADPDLAVLFSRGELTGLPGPAGLYTALTIWTDPKKQVQTVIHAHHQKAAKVKLMADVVTHCGQQAAASVRSRGGEGAAFLHADPSYPQNRLRENEVVALLNRYLLIPGVPNPPRMCPHCSRPGEEPVEAGEDHAFSCKQPGRGGLAGHHGSTHHSFQSAFLRAMHKFCRGSDEPVEMRIEPLLREQDGWARKAGGPGTMADKADVKVTYLNSNRVELIDFVISAATARNTSAWSNDGFQAAKAHKDKVASYAARWHHPPAGTSGGLVPFAVEAGGRMHPDARAWVARFIRRHVAGDKDFDDFTAEERADYSHHISATLTYLSVALQRCTARTVLQHLAAVEGYPLMPPA
jgi:hypothetical protein